MYPPLHWQGYTPSVFERHRILTRAPSVSIKALTRCALRPNTRMHLPRWPRSGPLRKAHPSHHTITHHPMRGKHRHSRSGPRQALSDQLFSTILVPLGRLSSQRLIAISYSFILSTYYLAGKVSESTAGGYRFILTTFRRPLRQPPIPLESHKLRSAEPAGRLVFLF